MALESGDHEFTFIFGVRSHRDNVFKRKYITRVIKRVEIRSDILFYAHLCRFVSLRFAPSVMSFWILSSNRNTNAEDLNVFWGCKRLFTFIENGFCQPNLSYCFYPLSIGFDLCVMQHWLRWRKESKIQTHKLRHKGRVWERERALWVSEKILRCFICFETMKKNTTSQ